MGYFDRRVEEKVEFCNECAEETTWSREVPPEDAPYTALWTCRGEKHPHPTQQEQRDGIKS